jgi:hypothetical protein
VIDSVAEKRTVFFGEISCEMHECSHVVVSTLECRIHDGSDVIDPALGSCESLAAPSCCFFDDLTFSFHAVENSDEVIAGTLSVNRAWTSLAVKGVSEAHKMFMMSDSSSPRLRLVVIGTPWLCFLQIVE